MARFIKSAGITACTIMLSAGLLHAAPIAGSAGSTSFTDGPNTEGLFFTINVNFEAFNGMSASDPLGVTPGLTQYAYILQYTSGNEHLSLLDVESIHGVPLLGTSTSTSGTVNGVSPGSFAPSETAVVTFASGNPAARFLFMDDEGEPFFGFAGARSVILVFTASSTYPVGDVVGSVRDSSLSDSNTVSGPADECPGDPNKTTAGQCGCGVADTDSDNDGTADCNDLCPDDPNKAASIGQCGCGTAETDSDNDGTPDCLDNCPSDPNKINPGTCGCGVSDFDSDNDGIPDCNDVCNGFPDLTDTDGDGTPDCLDGCPDDPNKTAAGQCGCGIADTDTDNDGTANCNDLCPTDPNKVNPGHCGCGTPETDSDGAGLPDCLDGCPFDPEKDTPGQCGCGVSDFDTDADGTPDCLDGCPEDPNKIAAGQCGCGIADTDTDVDNTADCNDGCPTDPFKTDAGICGCFIPDTDTDHDGVPDCNDVCPGQADTDSDLDGTLDCVDGCPTDPNKTDPGQCGCGFAETDTDGDGTANCNDGCPNDPNKTSPGTCGCGQSDAVGCLEGCTPGYWKNHVDRWVGYTPGQDFDTVFGVNAFTPNITLCTAVGREGGGVNALARHAVAALLGATHSTVDYPLTTTQIIQKVKAALASGGNIEGTKNLFEGYNELGCPLGGSNAKKCH